MGDVVPRAILKSVIENVKVDNPPHSTRKIIIQQGQRKAWHIPLPKNLILWPLPWKSIGFQILLRTKYVPSLVKIHWRMLILVFTRMLHGKNLTQWPWPWKSIGFQIFLRTKYVPSLVKIHWKMLILECSQGCYRVKIRPWPQPLTLKINRVPDSPKD